MGHQDEVEVDERQATVPQQSIAESRGYLEHLTTYYTFDTE
jgi:hypothetical protein